MMKMYLNAYYSRHYKEKTALKRTNFNILYQNITLCIEFSKKA